MTASSMVRLGGHKPLLTPPPHWLLTGGPTRLLHLVSLLLCFASAIIVDPQGSGLGAGGAPVLRQTWKRARGGRPVCKIGSGNEKRQRD